MAFLLYSTDGGAVPPTEYLAASAITPKPGLALVFSSGLLAKCGQTAAPEYIALTERGSALTAGDVIPVMRVGKGMVFETTAQAAMTGIHIGDRVTLHTDGLQVTATTTNGVAEVVGMDGTAAGSRVRVRF